MSKITATKFNRAEWRNGKSKGRHPVYMKQGKTENGKDNYVTTGYKHSVERRITGYKKPEGRVYMDTSTGLLKREHPLKVLVNPNQVINLDKYGKRVERRRKKRSQERKSVWSW